MTIEIHNAELEALLNERLRAGSFRDVEDMLLRTLKATQPDGTTEDELRRRAQAAAERIRELRKGVTLNRPEGMSLRDYAHIGHRY